MTTANVEPQTGRRTRLAHYHCDVGDRVLIGQRVDGIVRITDCPDGESGRSYLVEEGLETHSELQALINDYLAKTRTLGYVPMHGWF
jgi:hypothetical protein